MKTSLERRRAKAAPDRRLVPADLSYDGYFPFDPFSALKFENEVRIAPGRR